MTLKTSPTGRAVGILHDIDYEQWPEEHCVRAQSLLKELDVDESVIHAVCSHGYGLVCDVEPTRQMEKFLFATDEFTGPHLGRRQNAPHRLRGYGLQERNEEV